MGLSLSANVVCDKCLTTTIALANEDIPLPDGWMKAQGYANISAGQSAAVLGYFCPVCILANGTRDLVKIAADLCEDLTAKPA